MKVTSVTCVCQRVSCGTSVMHYSSSNTVLVNTLKYFRSTFVACVTGGFVAYVTRRLAVWCKALELWAWAAMRWEAWRERMHTNFLFSPRPLTASPLVFPYHQPVNRHLPLIPNVAREPPLCPLRSLRSPNSSVSRSPILFSVLAGSLFAGYHITLFRVRNHTSAMKVSASVADHCCVLLLLL